MKTKLTRIISLIICLFMIISVVSGASFNSNGFNFRMPFGQDAETSLLKETSGSVEAAGYADIEDEIIKYDNEPESTPNPAARPFDGDWDNAMHFFIRHWHSDPITSTSFQHNPDQDNATGRYFVILEGYIVPVEEYEYTMRGDGTFDPENLDENGDGLVSECKYKFCLVYQDTGEFDIYDENNQPDKKEYNEGDMREIYYDGGFVHKSEYIASINPQTGTITLKAAPSPNDSFAGLSISSGAGAIEDRGDRNLMPITYKPDIHLVKGHAFYVREAMIVDGIEDKTVFGEEGLVDDPEQDTAWVYTDASGNIIKDASGKPIMKGSSVTAEEGWVLKKFHDNEEGLHTDKTASVAEGYDDGRTFNVDLEAWYSEGYAPQVGMVIDASGSMAFASDIPSPINVNTLGAKVAEKLKDKIGFVEEIGFSTLIGYYEFNNNGGSGEYANYRDWYLNSVKKTPSTNYTDKNKEDFAKAVKQSTPETIDFSGAVPVEQCGDFEQLTGSPINSWSDPPVNLSAQCGFNLTSNGKDGVVNGKGYTGFMPEVEPEDLENFAIAFTLRQDKNEVCEKDIEILYIGAEQGVNNYFHVIRNGKDIIATVGGTEVAKITNAFTGIETHKIFFVFNDGNVTTYWDGNSQGEPVDIETLGGKTVVFAPFEDKNEQIGYFYVDDIYLYNNIARGTEAFLTPDEQRLILNPHNTDNSYLGVSGYTYFIYNPANGTEAYAPLGYNDQRYIHFGSEDNTDGAGWYYASHRGLKDINNTAKVIYGIPASVEFTDTITARARVVDNNEGAAPDMDDKYNDGNTGKKYKSTAKGPVKFYIDKNGYLRCFWASGNDKVFSSYVYKLTDAQYVRTEALRRAVGSFITNLNENSPSAEVSAVKFSAADLAAEQMVLLDWTSDYTKSVNVLTNSRGDGTFYGYDTINGRQLYSYGLTGGTNTVAGLKAFESELAAEKKTDPNYENIPKYLIIFTDGKDDNIEKGKTETDKAVAAADKLKKDGYTIFTVLLDGGVLDLDGTDKNVKDFLVSLSGNNSGAKSEDYFFSIDSAKKQLRAEGWSEEEIEDMDDADILTRIFQIEILSQITQPLEDYRIQDYIDPRFDLVDANGIVWQLKANGKVVKSDGTVIENVGNGTKITISANSNLKAQAPYLRYDSAKDMYYLQWDKQNIPGSAVGAGRLAVWNAQVTIRAKENFIGGNAILVGGNEAKENYVYREGDTDPRSDATHAGLANRGEDNGSSAIALFAGNTGVFYPSKGFPRVEVNVSPQGTGSESENTIYMGEKLSLDDVIGQFMQWEDATNLDDLTSSLYWEYILRYAEHSSMNYNELMSVFQTAEDGGIRSFIIPYYYLPNDYYGKNGMGAMPEDVYPSQNGTALHMSDCLGYLRYTWKVGTRRYPQNDGLIKDAYPRDSELTVKFIPYTEEERLSGDDFKIEYLKKLVALDGVFTEAGKIDETLLDNVLNMVIKNVLSGADLSKEPYKTILKEVTERILDTTDRYDDQTFTEVVTEICEAKKTEGSLTDQQLKDIKENIKKNDIISIRGSDINNRLINEKDSKNGTIYKWNPDYKPAAGDTVDIQNAINDHMVTKVVSGEVALRVDINKDDIKYMLDHEQIKVGDKIKCTADLAWGGTIIGTFEAIYTVPSAENLTEEQVVYAALNLKLTDDKGKQTQFIHDYGSNPKDNGWHIDDMPVSGHIDYKAPTYGLPIGTYTIENIDVDSDYMYFDGIKPIDITTDADRKAFNDNDSMLMSKIYFYPWQGGNLEGSYTDPDYSAYQAHISGNTAYLGTNAGAGENYTGLRYAMFGVKLKRAPDLPDSGGHGVVWIVITGVLLLCIGLIIFINRRRRAA